MQLTTGARTGFSRPRLLTKGRSVLVLQYRDGSEVGRERNTVSSKERSGTFTSGVKDTGQKLVVLRRTQGRYKKPDLDSKQVSVVNLVHVRDDDWDNLLV